MERVAGGGKVKMRTVTTEVEMPVGRYCRDEYDNERCPFLHNDDYLDTEACSKFPEESLYPEVDNSTPMRCESCQKEFGVAP